MAKNPRATVFVPTLFGEKYLEELLNAVFNQKVDYSYEVLIYDTSSTDNTVSIIEKFRKKHDNLRFKSITKEEFSHGGTRNQAAHDANGEFILYLTQDATPANEHWLYEMLKPFDISDRVVAVMGKQIPRSHCIPMLKSEIKGTFSNMGPDYETMLSYKDDFITGQGIFDAVRFYSDVNSAARVDFIRNTIPYRPVAYAEDQLFGEDVINQGYIKAYAPRGAVIHSNDLTLREYAKRMFDETYGLRQIGVNVAVPSRKLITKLIVRGVVRDWRNTLRDPAYTPRRKIYWMLANPLFHLQKWRGVRAATLTPLNNAVLAKKQSLEAYKNTTRKH